MAGPEKIAGATGLFREGWPIDEAVAIATNKAILHSKLLGQSIAIQRNGEVVIVPPEEIEVDAAP